MPDFTAADPTRRADSSVLTALRILQSVPFNSVRLPARAGLIFPLVQEGRNLAPGPDETAHNPGGIRPVAWRADSEVLAFFSDCARYRYALVEVWNPELPLIMWLLMNPSMAGLRFSDSTVTKTGKISRHHGAGGQVIVNTGAFRATKQQDLRGQEAIGPENFSTIQKLAPAALKVVLAYGKPPAELEAAGPEISRMLREQGADLYYLKKRLDGRPMHPLARGRSAISAQAELIRWGEAEEHELAAPTLHRRMRELQAFSVS